MNNNHANELTIAELRQLQFLTIQNCSKATGLPAGFLRQLAKEGKIPTVMSGRVTYIVMNELEAALAAL